MNHKEPAPKPEDQKPDHPSAELPTPADTPTIPSTVGGAHPCARSDQSVEIPSATPVEEPVPATVVPPPPHRPKIRLPITLFLLTCASTYLVGGPIYALAIMTILVCHESGHYLQARRYGVPASLPFFLPVPLPPIGTFGAVIAMEAGRGDRKALFDIGISGPLAGLVPTLIFCGFGVYFAEVVQTAGRGGHSYGEPLILQWFVELIKGPIPEGKAVLENPMLMAGWVGLLITSLNLIPVGQLDGGHVLYALLRRRAHYVAQGVLLVALLALLFYFDALKNWTVMLFLLILMGPYHPPTANDNVPLGPVRIILGWLILAFVVIGFTPTPFILPGR